MAMMQRFCWFGLHHESGAEGIDGEQTQNDKYAHAANTVNFAE
jgi:hypothetical protein